MNYGCRILAGTSLLMIFCQLMWLNVNICILRIRNYLLSAALFRLIGTPSI